MRKGRGKGSEILPLSLTPRTSHRYTHHPPTHSEARFGPHPHPHTPIPTSLGLSELGQTATTSLLLSCCHAVSFLLHDHTVTEHIHTSNLPFLPASLPLHHSY
uniref:Uncharacterized protein n=1 Tax=Palpitomonas bilix TaxID=652834 RepID=A0A7S3D8N2_9EUKA